MVQRQGLLQGSEYPLKAGGSAGHLPGPWATWGWILVPSLSWRRALTIVLSSPPPWHADSGQHLPLPVRHRRGHHVLLHGRPQAPQGLPGGPPVSGGEDEPGGAESAAGQALWGRLWGSALGPQFGACQKGVSPVTSGSPGLSGAWSLNSLLLALLLFSCSVVFSSLRPHGLRHTRLPSPSLSPGVRSNSCPLSRWYNPTSSSSVTPFSSCLQSFPPSGSFPVSWLFASGGQSIGALASVLPMNIQDWCPLELTGVISLQSIGLWRVFSSTTVSLEASLLSLCHSILYRFMLPTYCVLRAPCGGAGVEDTFPGLRVLLGEVCHPLIPPPMGTVYFALRAGFPLPSPAKSFVNMVKPAQPLGTPLFTFFHWGKCLLSPRYVYWLHSSLIHRRSSLLSCDWVF